MKKGILTNLWILTSDLNFIKRACPKNNKICNLTNLSKFNGDFKLFHPSLNKVQ